MNRKTRITMLISIPIMILAGILLIGSLYNQPHINVSESTPSISMISSELLDDFENDENNANTKYLEEIIQVTGTISELNLIKGNATIALSNQDSFGSVLCYLSPEQNIKMEALQKGQRITIKGICTGYLMDVILVKCVIIN